jgi:hypothetical protein
MIKARGFTVIGSPGAATISSFPFTPSPSTSEAIALLSGAVARMTRAPHIFVNASTGFVDDESIYCEAPSFLVKGSLSLPRPIATVLNPSLLAN